MIARGNQWYQGKNTDKALNVWDCQPTIMGITAQNMPKSFKINIATH